MRKATTAKRASLSGTSSGNGTTHFVKLSPELEACFVQAALTLGTRPIKIRDARHRESLRKLFAAYFNSVADCLPPYEEWPARLQGRMSDNYGNPLELFEKLAVAYMWWIDEHFRNTNPDTAHGPRDGSVLYRRLAGDGD